MPTYEVQLWIGGLYIENVDDYLFDLSCRAHEAICDNRGKLGGFCQGCQRSWNTIAEEYYGTKKEDVS